MKKSLIAVALCLMIAPLVSCGAGDVPPPTPPTPEEKEFKDVYFDSINVTYDGKEHTLGEVRGAPEGTNIVYDDRVPQIDVGTYKASATLSKEEYKTITLTATLNINPVEFSGLTYESVSLDYDGKDHFNDVKLNGELPSGTSKTQEVKNRLGQKVDKAIDPSLYYYSVTLTNKNYITAHFDATLTIREGKFDDATFSSSTVTYDGNKHKLGDVEGAPEDTTITYSGRDEYTDVGSYKATATLVKEGYETKILEATLTIAPAEFQGLTYNSEIVIYDGADHIKDVKLIGNLPSGTDTKQTVKYQGKEVKEAKAVGKYDYSIVITNKNYVTLTLTATLTIKEQRKYMPVYVTGSDDIYFANGLDSQRLYSLKTDGTFARIDYSAPKNIKRYSSSEILFNANTPLINSIKSINNNTTTLKYTDSKINDFVKYSDNVYYYSKNLLTSGASGIYKVDTTDTKTEPVVTKIYEGKADNLEIYDNDLYFINANDDLIYKINLTTPTDPIKVSEEKMHEFVILSKTLYCSVNGTFNDYIGYISLSSNSNEVIKLTNKAGEFLKVKNNKVYFNYTDWFGAVDPSEYGVWSVDVTSKEEDHLVETGNINGFDIEDNYSVVYTDTNDLHLYRYDPSSKIKTDLLAGFVKPEYTPVNTGGRTIANGSRVYYLDMYAGKTLCYYDEKTKKSYQLSTDKVEDFFIHNNKIYFNQVTLLTNNDIYCADLNVSSETVKINNNDLRNMITDGEYIYGTHYNFAGTAGGIARMKLDGSEYVKFSNINGAKNFVIRNTDERLYFINCSTGQDNGKIESIRYPDITPTSQDMKSEVFSDTTKNVKQFTIDGNDIFYIYNGITDNSIKLTFFSAPGLAYILAKTDTNPNEMVDYDGYIYYYSYPISKPSKAGFYRVSKEAAGEDTQQLILGYDTGTDLKYYASDLAFMGSNLYFMNYIPKLVLGNAHTYQLNVNSKEVKEIA